MLFMQMKRLLVYVVLPITHGYLLMVKILGSDGLQGETGLSQLWKNESEKRLACKSS